MKDRKITILAIALILSFSFQYCLLEKEKTSGGGTATGNVEGVILSKDKKPVGGAQVALFKKKAYVDSPDEKFKAFKEADTDEEGKFYFEVDEGDYTIVASAKNKYAFIDDIEAGTEDATNLKGVLLPPGALKGNIKNTIELQSLGSIVIHLIGTDIFKNAEKDGTFLITDIPAGEYTMVSYSTFQDEFAPAYRKVTIYPDSTTDISEYELHYGGIPIPQNIQVSYDTANSLVTITWDSISDYDDFQEFAILRGEAGGADHNLKQIGYTKKHKYVDSIVFKDFTEKEYEYAVKVKNMLGEAGKYYGIHAVTAVRCDKTIPEILGFKSEFDTLAGVVHLSWEGFKDEDERFKDYRLYRFSLASNKVKLKTDTIRVKSNAFTDTLELHKGSKSSDIHYYEYHVAVRQNKWELMGKWVKSSLIPVSDNKLRDAIPMVKKLNAVFDTLNGSMVLEWDFDRNAFAQFGGYRVIRKITEQGILLRTDTLEDVEGEEVKDILFPDVFGWDKLTAMEAVYSVYILHSDWDRLGNGSFSDEVDIGSYKRFKPVIDLGNDRHTDINSNVEIEGKIISATYPIVKKEFKIGEGEWQTTESGKTTFRTDSSYKINKTTIYFRVVDEMHNVSVDSTVVTKAPLIVTHNWSNSEPSATSTKTIVYFKKRFWQMKNIGISKMGVISSSDLKKWRTEKANPVFLEELPNKGIVHFFYDNRIWVILNKRSWRQLGGEINRTSIWNSKDGKNWLKVESNINSITTQATPTTIFQKVASTEDRMFLTIVEATANYSLITSKDGARWERMAIKRGSKIFSINNSVCLYHNHDRRCSEDGGKSWRQAPLWGENYNTWPDQIGAVYSNNTDAVAFYYEQPRNKKRVSIYRNGKWELYPNWEFKSGSSYISSLNLGIFTEDFFIFTRSPSYYSKFFSIKLR